MPAAAAKLTVEEYSMTPKPKEGRWELRHGELVNVTFPKKLHNQIQLRLLHLIGSALKPGWTVSFEVAFRPATENELWAADIAVVSTTRWNRIEDYLGGSPEVVIEVLSPSNTASEMLDREKTCFEGGCLEFWVVDPELRVVRVSMRTGTANFYASSMTIPAGIWSNQAIDVKAIFEG
jgi:Uma2 family endonuclease